MHTQRTTVRPRHANTLPASRRLCRPWPNTSKKCVKGALGRLHKSRTLYIGSQLAYVALAAAAFWLAVALELAGSWKLLIIVMLLGYYLAPGAIWYLTQATHGGRDEDAGPGRRA
jgi:hypothetical protein